jgi:hypothetical protein
METEGARSHPMIYGFSGFRSAITKQTYAAQRDKYSRKYLNESKNSGAFARNISPVEQERRNKNENDRCRDTCYKNPAYAAKPPGFRPGFLRW